MDKTFWTKLSFLLFEWSFSSGKVHAFYIPLAIASRNRQNNVRFGLNGKFSRKKIKGEPNDDNRS